MTLVRQLSECRRSLGLDKEVKNPLNLGWEWWCKLGLDPGGVDLVEVVIPAWQAAGMFEGEKEIVEREVSVLSRIDVCSVVEWF